jgi:PAS domain S-box-containing protein
MATIKALLRGRRLSEDLRKSEERFRSLIKAVTSVPWTTDPEGQFIEAQPKWESFTGQKWDEFKGFVWLEVLHSETRTRLLED